MIDDVDYVNFEKQDIETRKSKRGHVLGELLETERIYVAEMGSILRVSEKENIEKGEEILFHILMLYLL